MLLRLKKRTCLNKRTGRCTEINEHRAEILAHPEQYDSIIPNFRLEGMVPVSTTEKFQWPPLSDARISHSMYKIQALVTMFTGNIVSGGYWKPRCYCPNCREEYSQGMRHRWSTLARIAHHCALNCSASEKAQDGVGKIP